MYIYIVLVLGIFTMFIQCPPHLPETQVYLIRSVPLPGWLAAGFHGSAEAKRQEYIVFYVGIPQQGDGNHNIRIGGPTMGRKNID